jgi:N-acetylmuramoyl-L-alanine amidase
LLVLVLLLHQEIGIRTVQTLNREFNTRLDSLQARRDRWYKKLLDKKHRRRTIRYTLLTGNVLVLLMAIIFVAQKPNAHLTSSTVLSSRSEETLSDPLDELSSADVAVHIARTARLPEATSVTNLADTVNAQLAVTSTDDVIATKPQVIATGLPSRADIKIYVVEKGDTVAKIADKFGVTSNTIRWSNDIVGNEVSVGHKLVISPVNGIVYTVKSGDTIGSIASRYGADREKLIAINDLESGGLPVGQRIVIPDGVQPTAGAPARTTFNAFANSGFAFGNAPVYGYNGYDPGWCTWYAASRVSVPNNWGNANTWDDYAPGSGWTVSGIPKVGAVAQTDAGWAGHVGVVEAVSANGKMIKYSDMNGLAGFGRVGYSGWVPVHETFESFIYR